MRFDFDIVRRLFRHGFASERKWLRSPDRFLAPQLPPHAVLLGCNAQSLSLRAALMNIARMANGKCEQVRITPLKFRSCKKAYHVPPVHMIKLTKNTRSRLTFG